MLGPFSHVFSWLIYQESFKSTHDVNFLFFPPQIDEKKCAYFWDESVKAIESQSSLLAKISFSSSRKSSECSSRQTKVYLSRTKF